MSVKASSYRLNVCCKKHPNYRGFRLTECPTCRLLYVLIHQSKKVADERKLTINPYANLLSNNNLEEACAGLLVKTELSPSHLQFNRKKKVIYEPSINIDVLKGALYGEGPLARQ